MWGGEDVKGLQVLVLSSKVLGVHRTVSIYKDILLPCSLINTWNIIWWIRFMIGKLLERVELKCLFIIYICVIFLLIFKVSHLYFVFFIQKYLLIKYYSFLEMFTWMNTNIYHCCHISDNITKHFKIMVLEGGKNDKKGRDRRLMKKTIKIKHITFNFIHTLLKLNIQHSLYADWSESCDLSDLSDTVEPTDPSNPFIQ